MATTKPKKTNNTTQETPYRAFRFETPPVSRSTVSKKAFEFVLVEDNYLARFAQSPDPEPFSAMLSSCHHSETSGGHGATGSSPSAGCAFFNLGGDAELVAPADWTQGEGSPPPACYGHLAGFVRGATAAQIDGLWRLLGSALEKRLLSESDDDAEPAQQHRPVWLSTAGTGVAWLHFRLDSRPKYYEYKPYKVF